MHFSLKKNSTLKAIKSHFERSYDKQILHEWSFHMKFDKTHERLVSYEITTRVISSISHISYKEIIKLVSNT